MLIASAPTHPLAHLNALLNATATVLLIAGFLLIRRRRETAHKRTMISAFVVSTVFLASYVAYHFGVLGATHTKFQGQGWLRPCYFGILITHIVLAFFVPPLAIGTLILGLRTGVGRSVSNDPQHRPRTIKARRWHRRLARVTYPVWLYVSVTGVLVYWMLYQLAS